MTVTAALPAQMTREQIREQSSEHPPLHKPFHLQVLPADISELDLIETMVHFSEGLAVQCTYCHAFTPDHKELDFASEANPMKAKARIMLRMMNEINGKYLAEMPEPHKSVPAGCGTCHQGNVVPPGYKPPAGFALR